MAPHDILVTGNTEDHVTERALAIHIVMANKIMTYLKLP